MIGIFIVCPLRQTVSSTFWPTFFFKTSRCNCVSVLTGAAIDLRDDIKRPQIALVGGRVGFDRAHDDAVIDAFEQIADGRVVAERFDANAEPRPHDFVSGDQLFADFVHEIARNGEPQTAIQTVDQRIHADDVAIDVAERTAAVARD